MTPTLLCPQERRPATSAQHPGLLTESLASLQSPHEAPWSLEALPLGRGRQRTWAGRGRKDLYQQGRVCPSNQQSDSVGLVSNRLNAVGACSANGKTMMTMPRDTQQVGPESEGPR